MGKARQLLAEVAEEYSDFEVVWLLLHIYENQPDKILQLELEVAQMAADGSIARCRLEFQHLCDIIWEERGDNFNRENISLKWLQIHDAVIGACRHKLFQVL